jgi:hydroxyacylglutathione hydrolase
MFLKRFFEPKLAQASYMIGCAAAREAIVIDPNRDIDLYLDAAEAEGVRIAHVTETHIHADYLSGSRELAARTGATLYLSDEGDANWKYGFAGDRGVRLVKNGDRIIVGRVHLDVLHTPGHTPEHLTFLVTDTASASEPIGAATGDFIFAGDVGRPDLLERAAHISGTMETAARTLYASLQQFASRPDWLQLWPGHGAGSACGKGISAVPHTTLGYERRFNWAFQTSGEDDFVRRVLEGQPEPPRYFAEMKRLNKEGPALLHGFREPRRLDPQALDGLLASRAVIVDTRPASTYATGHIPGTINIPLNNSFTTWAGWFIPYDREFYVIVAATDGAANLQVRPPGFIRQIVRDLAMIGLDRIGGYWTDEVIDRWVESGRTVGTIPQITVSDLRESLRHDAVTLLDVRNQTEWDGGHIDGARHITLGYLVDHLDDVPRTRPVVVQCAAGARSAIGASILRARGFEQVINLDGGINEWRKAGLPTTDAVAVGT